MGFWNWLKSLTSTKKRRPRTRRPSFNTRLCLECLEDRISPAITFEPSTLLPGAVDNLYRQVLTASGGTGAYTFTQTAGALPPGITLSSAGLLGATPTQAGTFNFTVTASDGSGTQGNQAYTFTVYELALTPDVSSGFKGLAYSQQLTATGGTGAGYTYVVTAGTLPASITLSAAGLLSGTPSVGEVSNTFTITATDSGGNTGQQQYTLAVNPVITFTPGSLADGTENVAYPSVTFTASGGAGPYTYSLVSGVILPSGMTLSSAGVLSGTPTEAGTFNLAVTATDNNGDTATQIYPFTVNPGVIQLSSLPVAQTFASPGNFYSQTVSASGGSGSGYTFAVSHGSLPSGITLAPNGLLSGIPSVSDIDRYNFTVEATDSLGNHGKKAYALTVAYTPQQIRQAYGIDDIILSGGILGDGTGQTIAVVVPNDDPKMVSSTDASFTSSDLYQFDQLMGINRYSDPQTAPFFLKLDQNGGTNYPALSSDADGEETQDIQWIHALAPGANIIVFEATDSSDTNLQIAYRTASSYPGVSVISVSLAAPETSSTSPFESATDLTFLTPPNHNNVTWVFAAGDNRASGTPTKYPASSPFVLAAGMTELTLDGQGNYVSELGVAVDGGGPSLYEIQPSWQNGIVNAVSTTQRTTPDVSFNGATATGTLNFNSVKFGSAAPWGVSDGTSLATPSWAALLAIANQGRALIGQAPLDGPSQTLPFLYSLAGSADFHPITQLDNGTAVSSFYNSYSGLGSPVANLLIPDLVGGKNIVTGSVFNQVPGNGLVPPSTAGLAGWTVFLDANRNGILDPREAHTTTDANGNYRFVVAPGTYLVQVVVPPGWNLITHNLSLLNFPLRAFPLGAPGLGTVRFGFQPVNFLQTLINLTLLRDGTASTSPVIPLGGSTNTPAAVSAGPFSFYSVFPLNSDIFCVPRQETSGTGSTGVLSGTVFLEGNRNRGPEANGPAVAGLILVLEVEQDGKFAAVAVTVTDAAGAYSFTGLPRGNYRVRVLGKLRAGAKLGKNLIITINGENGAKKAESGATEADTSSLFAPAPDPLAADDRDAPEALSFTGTLDRADREVRAAVLQSWTRPWLTDEDLTEMAHAVLVK